MLPAGDRSSDAASQESENIESMVKKLDGHKQEIDVVKAQLSRLVNEWLIAVQHPPSQASLTYEKPRAGSHAARLNPLSDIVE